MQIKKLREKEKEYGKTKKGDSEPWAQPPQPSLPRLGKSCPVPLFPHPLQSFRPESEGLNGSRISLSWSEHRVSWSLALGPPFISRQDPRVLSGAELSCNSSDSGSQLCCSLTCMVFLVCRDMECWVASVPLSCEGTPMPRTF